MPPEVETTVPAARRQLGGGWLRSRRARIGLTVLLLLAVFIAAFDWTWLRPLIQHQVRERSGRRIDFDALRVGLDGALRPTIRFRNLVIENAAWAAARPLVRAAELGFTLSWESLRGERTIVTRLELVDAELDLERQADGLRNWRITRPDDRGPGRVRVLALEARNVRARYVDGGLGLALQLQAAPLASPGAVPSRAGLPLTQHLTLEGTRDGAAFTAQVDLSDELTLFDTGRPFALRGELQAGPSRLALDGSVADLAAPARLDLEVRIDGPRIADLGRVFGQRLPLPPLPTQASAHLLKEADRWRVSALQARVGRSDLAGELSVARQQPDAGRSLLQATLTSRTLNLADFRPAAAGAAASPTKSPAGSGQPATADTARATGAGRLDADLDISVAQVDGLPPGPLTAVKAHAALREGRWAIDPAAFTVAGGRASGTLAIDALQAPTAYALDLRLQGAQIERLGLRAGQRNALSGGLDLHAALRSRGDSAGALAGALSGTLQAELVRASMADALDAKLALDGGRVLRNLFDGSGRSAVLCSALDLRVEAGRASVRRLALETPRVALTGTGWVDLGRGSVDLVLNPRRKQVALLALDRAVSLSGPLKAPKLALVAPGAARPAAACAPGSVQRVQ